MRYYIALLSAFFLAVGVVDCRRVHQILPVTKTVRTQLHQVVTSGGDAGITAQHRQISTKKAAALGCLLALNSGVVNGACLSGILHPTKQVSWLYYCVIISTHSLTCHFSFSISYPGKRSRDGSMDKFCARSGCQNGSIRIQFEVHSIILLGIFDCRSRQSKSNAFWD